MDAPRQTTVSTAGSDFGLGFFFVFRNQDQAEAKPWDQEMHARLYIGATPGHSLNSR